MNQKSAFEYSEALFVMCEDVMLKGTQTPVLPLRVSAVPDSVVVSSRQIDAIHIVGIQSSDNTIKAGVYHVIAGSRRRM
jgi:hypothetical protein